MLYFGSCFSASDTGHIAVIDSNMYSAPYLRVLGDNTRPSEEQGLQFHEKEHLSNCWAQGVRIDKAFNLCWGQWPGEAF